jgi:hypothetical protein
MLKACRYCQDPANREELIALLEKEPGLQHIADALANSLRGRFRPASGQSERSLPDFHIFSTPPSTPPIPRPPPGCARDSPSPAFSPPGKLPKDSFFRTDLFDRALTEITP